MTDCMIYTSCDSRCEGIESHMHCHFCGSPLELEHKNDDEALWRCMNTECERTEVVTGYVREAPLSCDCRELMDPE